MILFSPMANDQIQTIQVGIAALLRISTCSLTCACPFHTPFLILQTDGGKRQYSVTFKMSLTGFFLIFIFCLYFAARFSDHLLIL